MSIGDEGDGWGGGGDGEHHQTSESLRSGKHPSYYSDYIINLDKKNDKGKSLGRRSLTRESRWGLVQARREHM